MTKTLDEMASADPLEEKRQLIFGSLMLYSAESIPLRDRALEAAVLAALVGSSLEKPMRNGDVQRIIRAGLGEIGVRQEVIRETLHRLIDKGLVQAAEFMRKPVYYLTEAGDRRTRQGTLEAQSLFDPVLEEILANADQGLDRKQAASVSKDFISSAFARFGASIADHMAGRKPHFANSIELAITFDQIAAKHFVPGECRESLKARCLNVFRHSSLATHRLILHLTQGHCFAQLLGVDRGVFNPITDEAFKGAVFYLDTNVLFAGLLPGDRGDAFGEILAIARRVGADLRVTRATIDETRHTAAEKLATLEKIVGTVPDQVGELSTDEFVSHFYELRRSTPGLRPSEFLADFDTIADVVRDRWSVTLEELTEDVLLEGVDIDDLGSKVQAATLDARGWPKSQHVLWHDIAHLNLVRTARETSPKTWFLTRDGSLLSASEDLARSIGPEERPLCFQMLGFLQSISPFVSSTTEENVLADFFSGLLTEQIFVPEKLFDDKELALISVTHADVMAMPSDQVVVAVDYVKRHVLKGQRYSTDRVPEVALELRKYLSANTEERQRTLQALADANHERYETTKQAMLRERSLREEYEKRLEEAERELEEAKAVSSAQQQAIEEIRKTQQETTASFQKKESSRNTRDRRILLSILSVASGFSLGHFNQPLRDFIMKAFHLAATSTPAVTHAFGFIKVGLLLAPLLFFIPSFSDKQQVRTGLIALVVIVWFWLAGIQSSTVLGEISNAATVALYVTLFLTVKDD